MEDSRFVSLEKDIQYIKKESSENKKLILETQKILDEKFDLFIEKLDSKITATENKFLESEKQIYNQLKEQDKKFASKYVESAFWWLVATVFSLIIAALGSLIFIG